MNFMTEEAGCSNTTYAPLAVASMRSNRARTHILKMAQERRIHDDLSDFIGFLSHSDLKLHLHLFTVANVILKIS
jgi:hypothetical protein